MDKKNIFLILFCIFLPLFLLLLSYQTALQFYPQTAEQKTSLDFVRGITENPALNYTAGELSHLEDVKNVMNSVEYVFLFSFLMVIIIIGINIKNKLMLKKLFLCGGIATVVLVGLILLFSWISFNSSFTTFHKIFFPLGNWQFPESSLLIQTFPIDFFINISLIIFLQAILLGIIFIGAGYFLKNGRIIPKD